MWVALLLAAMTSSACDDAGEGVGFAALDAADGGPILADAAGDIGRDVEAREDTAGDTLAGDTLAGDTLAGDTLAGDTLAGGTIAIYLAGDRTPKAYADDLSGQTPSGYTIALGAYEVMTSMSDPDPQPCFDLGAQVVEADLAGDTLVGTCQTAAIQTALYTHGRVRVAWARYTVEATVHALGGAFPGQVTFFRAYSQTTYEGVLYPPNTGWVRFSGVSDTLIPWTYAAQPSGPLGGGVRLDLIDGMAWLSFPYTRPLFVDSTSADAHWARFHWEIGDAFRWAERSLPGYTSGTWDVAQPLAASEEVKSYGVSGYHITASTD